MADFSAYARSIHRSEGTIRRYCHQWQKIKDFMSSKKILHYDANTEKGYLAFKLGNYDYHQLDQHGKLIVNTTETLAEFQRTGRINMGARKHHPKVFDGHVGCKIKDFIDYRERTLNLSAITVQSYRFHLYPFCCYINSKGLNISVIKASELMTYIQQMSPSTPANKHVALNILRCFFKYLYEQQILSVDYSRIIPKDNYKNQPKLPSTFTDGEINALLNAVDRGNPRGKRDYAILLLATQLGLRASDISELKFDNIIWDRNTITLNQHKTGKALELPLLPELGNAIVDYLKYGRPVTNDSHCFVHVQGPYDRIHTSDIGNLVRKYITLAKINYLNRKHGPHALRHSFASALLKENISLPVISEALGHSILASTMEYLRIDINTLQKCALEVPSLNCSFYEQKGGYYHD